MEHPIWKTVNRFIRESYQDRLKESFAGVLMGCGVCKSLLFSGVMADLVSAGWWLMKGIGSLVLVFLSSMLTSYGAHLVNKWTDPQKKSPKITKRKKAA